MKGGMNVKFTYSWLVRFIKLLLDLFFPEEKKRKEEKKKGGEKEE